MHQSDIRQPARQELAQQLTRIPTVRSVLMRSLLLIGTGHGAITAQALPMTTTCSFLWVSIATVLQ